MKIQEINVASGQFRVITQELGELVKGTVSSAGLKVNAVLDHEDVTYNDSIDVLGEFLLAMTCEGLDVNDPRIKKALETIMKQRKT